MLSQPSGFLIENSGVSITSGAKASAAVRLMRVEAHTMSATSARPGIKSSINGLCRQAMHS